MALAESATSTQGYYYKPPPVTTHIPIGGTATPAAAASAPTAQPEAPQAPTASQTTQTPAVDFSHLDFSNDPILGRIKALNQETIAQAEADAKAARTRLIIGYGDESLAGKLGLGGKVGKQAKGNPFSILAELKRAYERRNVFDIDRQMSDYSNLFYSTERGRQRALSGEEYLRGQSKAEAGLQEALAGISSQVTQAKLHGQLANIQAEQDAYQRAVEKARFAAGV